MKVAIIHYWLVGMRGGEKVVESLCDLYPEADIYCHVYDPLCISNEIRNHKIKTTFIHKLPFAKRYYQLYLPLMPLALEQLDLREYDLVISSESGPAKGVIVGPDTLHICYCHSPMRYVWDMYQQYYKSAGIFKKLLMVPLMHYIRIWDRSSSKSVDHYIANSEFVARRIEKYYRRKSTVINPPVDTTKFTISNNIDDHYLMVGQLVRYKRADLAVEAFNKNGKQLVIIGEGEQFNELKQMAKSNIKILGNQSFDVIKEYYSACKALIFPGIEDFGIVPLEAMASGRPVIAYNHGGALETVCSGVTGIFFTEQTPQSLNKAIEEFELREKEFRPQDIRDYAKKYDKEIFKLKMKDYIQKCLERDNRNRRI